MSKAVVKDTRGFEAAGDRQTVEYHPPEQDDLDRFARQVCREMGLDQRRGIVYDLAGFMQVLARACAKDLNRKNENGEALDNGHETA